MYEYLLKVSDHFHQGGRRRARSVRRLAPRPSPNARSSALSCTCAPSPASVATDPTPSGNGVPVHICAEIGLGQCRLSAGNAVSCSERCELDLVDSTFGLAGGAPMSSLSLREKDQTRVELLQALLRWRRAQLTRRDVGLLPRSGARTGHGLSQDDLAELTGYSERIISQLEHGKLRSPSSDLLDAVCPGLRMTADERRTLWLLAAGTAPPPGPYATGADMGLARLVNQLYPHPAYVTDAVWDVEIYNKAVAEWFTDFSEIPV